MAIAVLDALLGGLNQLSSVSVYGWMVPSVYSIMPVPDSLAPLDAPSTISCVAADEPASEIV